MFYDSKVYFWLMVEWMFFVFIFLQTETSKIKNIQILDEKNKVQIEQIMNDARKHPEKYKSLYEEINKK